MEPTQANPSKSPLTNESIFQHATEVEERFVAAIRDAPYESKGVFFSEMLFVYAAVGLEPHELVLESGRARGQSTYVLGKIFPDSKIISIEFDPDSPDVTIAQQRLSGLTHIELLFGDSQRLLFKHLKPDAVVVIDGPKGFRALRLAMKLLGTGMTRMVFVHDAYRGLRTRQFLEQHVPGALFSDHDAYVNKFRHLDQSCWQTYGPGGALEWRPNNVKTPSYGPTFACLPYNPDVSYRRVLMQLHLANFMTRLTNTFGKSLGRRHGATSCADC